MQCFIFMGNPFEAAFLNIVIYIHEILLIHSIVCVEVTYHYYDCNVVCGNKKVELFIG